MAPTFRDAFVETYARDLYAEWDPAKGVLIDEALRKMEPVTFPQQDPFEDYDQYARRLANIVDGVLASMRGVTGS